MGVPVCIAGMHRSGTSLLAALLHHCGLDLGPERELMPATEDNPLGYMENLRFTAFNDRILRRAGGTWDKPPVIPVRPASLWRDPLLWLDGKRLIRATAGLATWGWKDPRNSLTLPFWLKLLPDMKVVVCVRHPLEVDQSMRHRVRSRRENGIDLWRVYNRRILDTVQQSKRLIVLHSSLIRNPAPSVARILSFVGLPAETAACADLQALVRPELHRHKTRDRDELDPETGSLFRLLAAEAEDRPSSSYSTPK